MVPTASVDAVSTHHFLEVVAIIVPASKILNTNSNGAFEAPLDRDIEFYYLGGYISFVHNLFSFLKISICGLFKVIVLIVLHATNRVLVACTVCTRLTVDHTDIVVVVVELNDRHRTVVTL